MIYEFCVFVKFGFLGSRFSLKLAWLCKMVFKRSRDSTLLRSYWIPSVSFDSLYLIVCSFNEKFFTLELTSGCFFLRKLAWDCNFAKILLLLSILVDSWCIGLRSSIISFIVDSAIFFREGWRVFSKFCFYCKSVMWLVEQVWSKISNEDRTGLVTSLG